MARLLITGGAGFIGSNFVHYWLREHAADRVVVLDALTYAGNLANLRSVAGNPQYRFVRGDIGDRALVERLLREESLDTIVHFAAESHVDRSITGPGAFVQTNVVGTYELLEAARQVWLVEHSVDRHRFHHVSTDEVYGSLGPDEAPFAETTAYAPNSPYSASKAASDHLVRAYHHTYGLSTTTSNCSNNYGPYHFPEKLIPLMIVNILHGRPLPIYGDGRNVRDWLYVDDHCRGIDLVLALGREGEVYNIGGRAECENLQLVRLLCEHADRELSDQPELHLSFPDSPARTGRNAASLIQFVTDRPGHDRRYAIDCSKIERELGFKPTVSLAEGLRRTLTWYLGNAPWWQSVMDGRYQDWIKTQYPGG
jgi:dTDP-glucose 4,6-dehydratase